MNTPVFFCMLLIQLIQFVLKLSKLCIAAAIRLSVKHLTDYIANAYRRTYFLFILFVEALCLDFSLWRIVDEGSILLIKAERLIVGWPFNLLWDRESNWKRLIRIDRNARKNSTQFIRKCLYPTVVTFNVRFCTKCPVSCRECSKYVGRILYKVTIQVIPVLDALSIVKVDKFL